MEWIELGELAEINNGYAFKSKKYKDEGVRIIRITNVQKGYIEDSDPKYYSEKDMDKLERFNLSEGDILISLTGNVGRVARVTKEILPAALNQRVASIKPKEDINNDYLFYMMNSNKFENLCISESNGVAQKNLGTSSLSKLKIPVPPINIQKQIVEVLDQAQKLIDNRKTQIKLLDDLIESVFYDMFGDPVINDMGWLVCNVEEVCEKIVGGGTPSKSKPEYYIGEIPWVTPKDMKTLNIIDSQDHINDLAIQNSSAKLIPSGSLLMVIRSGILKRYLPIALNSVDVTINQDMKAFLIDGKKIDKYFFLYFWMLAQRFILTKVRSVTADNIEFKQIKEMKIITPPINLQNQFAEKVELIEKQKQLLENSLKLLEDNYNALIQRAFKGQLF